MPDKDYPPVDPDDVMILTALKAHFAAGKTLKFAVAGSDAVAEFTAEHITRHEGSERDYWIADNGKYTARFSASDAMLESSMRYDVVCDTVEAEPL